MADQTKKIILEVSVAEQDKALKQAAELRKEIERLNSEQKKYTDKLAEKGKLTNKEAIEYERLKSQISNVTKEYKEVQRVATAYNQVQSRNIGSYKQLNALIQIEETKLKNLVGTLERTADGELILTDAYRDQKKIVEELNKTRIQFDQGINVGRTNVGNYTTSIVQANQRIKELDDIINNSDMGSKEFRDAKDEADKLRLSIDQALGKVDEFGNREPRNPAKKVFDDAVESGVALASATGLIISLFGEESDVSKNLAKAMQAVAIAQAGANILKAKGAVLDTADIVTKKVQIGLQRTYSFVVGESTGALKAFRIALAATGVGLFVLGITAVVQAFSKKGGLTDATETQTSAQDKLTESIQKTNQAIQDIKDQFDNPQESPYAQQIFDLQRLINLRKAQGENEIQLLKLENQLNELKIKNLNLVGDALLKNGLAGQTTTIELQNQIADLQNQIAINNANIQAAEKEHQEKLNEIDEKNLELRIKTSTDGYREKLLLFDLSAKKERDDAIAAGLDIVLVDKDIAQRRQEIIDDMNAEIGSMLIDTAQFHKQTEFDLTTYMNNQLKQRQADFDKFQQDRKDKLTEESEFTREIFMSIGQAFADSIDESGINLEKFSRDVIVLLLDTLEKQIQAAIAATIAKEIAASALTPIGLLKAAGKIGLITAAFESAKAVINRPVKFEDGGGIDIGGKRHSEGGTKFVGDDGTMFEAEIGEKIFIVNRGASAFLNQIGTINDAFRKKAYHGQPNFLADGGFVQRRLNAQSFDSTELKRAFSDALKNQKQPVVRIREINELNESIETAARLSEL